MKKERPYHEGVPILNWAFPADFGRRDFGCHIGTRLRLVPYVVWRLLHPVARDGVCAAEAGEPAMKPLATIVFWLCIIALAGLMLLVDGEPVDCD
jgi:hypothetical protein